MGCPLWLLLRLVVVSHALESGMRRELHILSAGPVDLPKLIEVWCIVRPRVLRCPAKRTINVYSAWYSNHQCNELPRASQSSGQCSLQNTQKVKSATVVQGAQVRCDADKTLAFKKYCDTRQNCSIPKKVNTTSCPAKTYNCMRIKYSCVDAPTTTVETGTTQNNLASTTTISGPRARAQFFPVLSGQSSTTNRRQFTTLSQADKSSLDSALTSTSFSSKQQEADKSNLNSALTSTSFSNKQQEADKSSLNSALASTSFSNTQQEADKSSLNSALTSTSFSNKQQEVNEEVRQYAANVKMHEDQDSKLNATTTSLPCRGKAAEQVAAPVIVKIHVNISFPQ